MNHVVLAEMTETELAAWNAKLDAANLPTTREVREGKVDLFHKGPWTWQRTRD